MVEWGTGWNGGRGVLGKPQGGSWALPVGSGPLGCAGISWGWALALESLDRGVSAEKREGDVCQR